MEKTRLGLGFRAAFILAVMACAQAYGADTATATTDNAYAEECELNKWRLGFRVAAIKDVQSQKYNNTSDDQCVKLFTECTAKIPELLVVTQKPGHSQDAMEIQLYKDFKDKHPVARLFAMQLSLNLSNLSAFEKRCDDILREKDVPLAVLKFFAAARKSPFQPVSEPTETTAKAAQVQGPRETIHEEDLDPIASLDSALSFIGMAQGLIEADKNNNKRVIQSIEFGFGIAKEGSLEHRLGNLIKANIDNLSALKNDLTEIRNKSHVKRALEDYLGQKRV